MRISANTQLTIRLADREFSLQNSLEYKVVKAACVAISLGTLCLAIKNNSLGLGAASVLSLGYSIYKIAASAPPPPELPLGQERHEDLAPPPPELLPEQSLHENVAPSPQELTPGDEWMRSAATQEWLDRQPNARDRDIAAERIKECLNNPQMTRLDLCRLNITSLPDNLNLPTLMRLLLIKSQITSLPDNLNVPSLRELNLAGSQVTSLPDNLNLPALKWLNLSQSQITSLPDNFNPPHLIDLNAALSSLRSLPPSFNPPRLTCLYLHFSSLNSLPAGFNPPNLRTLTLEGCMRFTRLPYSILNFSNSCTISLTLSNFPQTVQRRLTSITSQEHYLGPRFVFDMSTVHSSEGSESPSVAMQNLLNYASDDSNADNLLDALLQKADSSSVTKGNIHTWLDRIFWSASAHAENKKAFFRSIVENLKEVSKDDELRSFFQDLVGGTTSTCGDGITLSTLQIANQVKAKTMDTTDAKAVYEFLVQTVYAMDVLHKTADNIIPELPLTDPIEVYLGLPFQLKEEFNIGININEMLFFNCSGLKEEYLGQARKNLREALDNKDQVMIFLLEQPKWLELLKGKFSDRYTAIEEEKYKGIEDPSVSLLAENTYKQALKRLSERVIEEL